MPVTPQRKVTNQTALQVPRTSAAATGGQEAQALGQLGGAVQSVSVDAENIMKQHDTFKAQKTYNDYVDQALNGTKEDNGLPKEPGYTAYSQRSGQQAFGSAASYSKYLESIKQKALEGLSPRQQRIFLQNAEPKSISLKQQMAKHEMVQVEAAQKAEKNRTLQRSTEEFGRTGHQDDRKAAVAAFDSLAKSMTPEDREIARAQLDEALDRTRRDSLIKAQDFAGAYEFANLTPEMDLEDPALSDRQKEDLLYIQDAERAHKNEQINIEKKQIQNAQDQAAIWSYTNNELAPLEKYVEWNGGNVGMATRARDADLVKRAQLIEKLKDEQFVLEANDPDTRSANYLDIERNLKAFELGQITSAELDTYMERIKPDTSDYAARLRTRAAKTITDRMQGKTDEQQRWLTDTRIQMAEIYNTANQEAVWGWTKKAVPGKVILSPDKTKIKSHDDASSGFARLMDDFETALQQQRDMLKRPLTFKEYDQIENDYLGAVKQFSREEQFRGDSTVYLESLPIGPDSPYWNPDRATSAPPQSVSGYDVLMAEFNSINSSATNEVGPYVQSPSNR